MTGFDTSEYGHSDTAWVTVTLTSDEALVLFDLLYRWEDLDAIDTVLMPGEQTVLWGLCCRLESILVEPFEPTIASW